MTISATGTGAYRSAKPNEFVTNRSQFDDLQRQLVSQKKSETYGDLGIERRTSLDLNSKVSTIDSWLSGIQLADVNLKLSTNAVENFATLANETKNDVRSSSYVASASGRSAPQVLAEEKFKQTLDLLNISVNGRYLFSGRASDQQPTAGFSDIFYGDGAGRDGLETLIKERNVADGATAAGHGRLTTTVPVLTPTTVAVARDNVDVAYGFTLHAPPATTNSAGLVIAAIPAAPAAPTSFTVDVAAQPLVGEALRVKLDLPDGTTEEIVLTARAAGTTMDNTKSFEVGATPAATAANLRLSIESALGKSAQTTLRSASATATATDFFRTDKAPDRVVTTDYTQPPAPDATRTVAWYKGDNVSELLSPARATATVQVDQAQIVGTGARASEEVFRVGLASFATLALEKFMPSDTYPQAAYEALADRTRENLGFGGNVQKPAEILTEFGTAQTSLAQAKERNQTTKNYLTTTLAGVENVTTEEVATQILSVQNTLQASYQVTSLLSKLTLTNYL